MHLNLNSKHVVITGGTRGIGLKITEKYLQEGALVHVIARSERNSEIELLQQQYAQKCFFYSANIANENEWSSLLKQIANNSGGTIDILVANVGGGAGNGDSVLNGDEWNRLWDLNFNSALYSVRNFESMLLKSKGNILFISSIAGINYVGAPVAYSVSKAALITFAKNLSFRLAPHIRVNTIAPGNILFENGTWDLKLKNNKEQVNKMLLEKVPLQKLGTTDDIANAALFLTSSLASFITGSCLVIDGGQSI